MARRRNVGAVAASIAFHASVLLLALASAGGAIVTGGDGAGITEESAVTVSLAGLRGSRQAEVTHDDGQLQLLYRKALADQAELYATDQRQTKHTSLASLFDAIERARGGSGKPEGAEGQANTGQQPTSNRESDAPRRSERPPQVGTASPLSGPGAAASSGGLWGQIEPCWQHMPHASTVSVTLQVTLDEKGMISKPPQVIRPEAAALDERRLIAEARALAALSACLPYDVGSLLLGPRTYTVEFQPRSAGAKPKR